MKLPVPSSIEHPNIRLAACQRDDGSKACRWSKHKYEMRKYIDIINEFSDNRASGEGGGGGSGKAPDRASFLLHWVKMFCLRIDDFGKFDRETLSNAGYTLRDYRAERISDLPEIGEHDILVLDLTDNKYSMTWPTLYHKILRYASDNPRVIIWARDWSDVDLDSRLASRFMDFETMISRKSRDFMKDNGVPDIGDFYPKD